VKCDLILALDLPDEEQALRLLDRIGDDLRWVKIGLQLFTRHGPRIVEQVAERGYNVFLDLKLHDIPNTVGSAVTSLCGLPIDLLTLHTCGGSEMMRAAEAARTAGRPSMTLLGVTVLTSMDSSTLGDIGVRARPAKQVSRLARLACDSGIGGLVCSPLELPILRKELGQDPVIVTPGVRPRGADVNDQKRIMTPADAARAGASYIVVGRPIYKANDPRGATRAVIEELSSV
jgi:orotidine-5'-phosphate decarboxylase